MRQREESVVLRFVRQRVECGGDACRAMRETANEVVEETSLPSNTAVRLFNRSVRDQDAMTLSEVQGACICIAVMHHQQKMYYSSSSGQKINARLAIESVFHPVQRSMAQLIGQKWFS
jgi:hypothetical protein